MTFNTDPDAFDQQETLEVGNLITLTHFFNGYGTADTDGEESRGRIEVVNNIAEIVHVVISIDADEFNPPGVDRQDGGARAWDVDLQSSDHFEFDMPPNETHEIDYTWQLELKFPNSNQRGKPFHVGLIISATASLSAQSAVSDEHITEVN